jgi:hypothetical protein
VAIASSDEYPIWSPESQLQWFEERSAEDLTNWLRRLVLVQSSHPLISPNQARPVTYFANLLARGTPELTCKIREVVPRLVQEWTRNASAQYLDDLLVLAGLLKGTAAEATIVIIAAEKITGRPDEVQLRQRCLSVLSGFGCSEYSAPLFNRYLEDIDYSAYCFRALYKYNLSYAVTTLPAVVATHEKADKLQALRCVLNFLFFDHLNKRQRVALWGDIISSTEPVQLKEMLRTLQSLDIVLSVPRRQEIEVIYDYTPKKAGEKVPFYDFKAAALAAINGALQTFLMRSDRPLEQAVAASAR